MPIFENFSDSYLSRSIKIKSKLHVHDSFLAAPPLLSLVKIKLHVSQVTPLHSLSDSQTKCTFFHFRYILRKCYAVASVTQEV